MKTQKEQSRIIKPTIGDDSQLDVEFKDGKLIHMSIINSSDKSEHNASNTNIKDEPTLTNENIYFCNGELHLTAENISLVDEPTLTNENIYFRNGELHLTAENISLVDEIKILIRKLWN